MGKPTIDEQILRTSKEIVVKFIETGRVSPTGFPDIFRSIYNAVQSVVKPGKDESDNPQQDQG